MIYFLEIILVMFFGIFILLPVYVNVFRERIYKDIQQRIERDIKIKNMKKRG